ncbi:MAG: hemerythrin domain-containing protein [Planctomycetota bacterium]
MSIKASITIQELLSKHPQAGSVLRRFGIDPDEQTTLAAAAWAKDAPIERLLAALNEIIGAPVAGDDLGGDWSVAETKELIDYLDTEHHAYLRRELPHLEHLTEELLPSHPRHGTMLMALQSALASLQTEIEEHLRVEEEILFPRACYIEHHLPGESSSPLLGGVPIDVIAMDQMTREHDLVGKASKEMRGLTSNYAPPEDADETFAALYEGLAMLEAKLREHIDLEDAFLWPARLKALARRPGSLGHSADGPAGGGQDICPRTHQRCDAGSYATCTCFWECVAEALASGQAG